MAEVQEPKQRDTKVNQYVSGAVSDDRSKGAAAKTKAHQDQGKAGNENNVPGPTHSERNPEIVATGQMLGSFDEMDRMMDRVLEGFMPRGLLRSFGFDRDFFNNLSLPFLGKEPKVDIIDRHQDILVRVEVPGMEKDDLHVSVTGRKVTISGRKKRESQSEEGEYFRSEISHESFQRSVPLPVEVDGAQGHAEFKNGVLELRLPKVDEAKRHNVPVH